MTELGKVMKLLLQLSGRLARANNALNAMMDGEDKEKVRIMDEVSGVLLSGFSYQGSPQYFGQTLHILHLPFTTRVSFTP